MKNCLTLLLLIAFTLPSWAQKDTSGNDLLNMLNQETQQTRRKEITTATFKTTRIVNGHSIENVGAGVLDLRFNHRFGRLNQGAKDLFGLDNAYIRIGLEYGIWDRLMVGVGRSSIGKEYDGFLKYKLLQQSTGGKNMPITLSLFTSMVINTEPWADPTRQNYFSSRLYYTHQLLIARKFSEGLSLEINPTYVHYNLAPSGTLKNDFYSIGIGGRQKIGKRMSLNVEYYYQLSDYKLPGTTDALSVGIDIETGGHVFQLLFSNSRLMNDKSFITQTTGKWGDGDIHFGFNLSRVFTIKKPKSLEGTRNKIW